MLLYGTHDAFALHDTGPHHPERPSRLGAVRAGIERAALAEAVVPFSPRQATDQELTRVHAPAYLEALARLCEDGGGLIDADTTVSAASWSAARLAAGTGLEAIRLLLLMLAPAAPHIAEELWSRRAAATGERWTSIHLQAWPEVDASAARVSVREVPVQVNGKLRDKVVVASDADQATIEKEALASPKIAGLLAGRTPDRVIHAGGKLVNIVLRDG